jgi:hypothetical protein
MRARTRSLASIVLALSLLLPAFASAAAKKYQVTGKVLEVNDKTIVVQTTKGDERWEIERTADTKIDGDLKVGAKVTIEYRMVAANVEVKSEK